MRLMLLGFLCLLSMFVIVTSQFVVADPPEITIEEYLEVILVTPEVHYNGDLKKFMERLAFYESSGVVDVVSRNGMLGKYQFSPRTLGHLGFTRDIDYFLSNEYIQDEMLVLLLRNNRRVLRNVIEEFDQSVFNGIYITESGILAGAHLLGPGGVLSYFYPDSFSHATSDGNGTRIETYLTRFSNFELDGNI